MFSLIGRVEVAWAHGRLENVTPFDNNFPHDGSDEVSYLALGLDVETFHILRRHLGIGK